MQILDRHRKRAKVGFYDRRITLDILEFVASSLCVTCIKLCGRCSNLRGRALNSVAGAVLGASQAEGYFVANTTFCSVARRMARQAQHFRACLAGALICVAHAVFWRVARRFRGKRSALENGALTSWRAQHCVGSPEKFRDRRSTLEHAYRSADGTASTLQGCAVLLFFDDFFRDAAFYKGR